MSKPTTSEVLRVCFRGDGRRSAAGLVAVLAAWCSAIAVLLLNALFPLLFPDGNLLIRAVCTFVLGAPLLGLYLRAQRSLAVGARSSG